MNFTIYYFCNIPFNPFAMKKSVCLALFSAIILGLTACGDSSDEDNKTIIENYYHIYKSKTDVYTSSPTTIAYQENGELRLPIYLQTDIGEVKLTAYIMDYYPPRESRVSGWLSLVLPDRTLYQVGTSLNMISNPFAKLDILRFDQTDTIQGPVITEDNVRTITDTVYTYSVYDRYMQFRTNHFHPATYQNISHTDWYNEILLEDEVLILSEESIY